MELTQKDNDPSRAGPAEETAPLYAEAARRRALGNAFAPPYLRWIGERIEGWERGC